MDKEQIIHDLALAAAKAHIETNMPEYVNSPNGYTELINDLKDKYEQAVSILKSDNKKWLY